MIRESAESPQWQSSSGTLFVVQESVPWSTEELGLLAKGLQKSAPYVEQELSQVSKMIHRENADFRGLPRTLLEWIRLLRVAIERTVCGATDKKRRKGN